MGRSWSSHLPATDVVERQRCSLGQEVVGEVVDDPTVGPFFKVEASTSCLRPKAVPAMCQAWGGTACDEVGSRNAN